MLPLQSRHFNLSAQEFQDALASRYRKPLLNLPAYCDGCGSSFGVEHALDCRVGGLVGQCHNEVRDAVCDLATLVWSQVQKELIVCEASHDDLSSGDTLVADLRVRSVWHPYVDALFDVRVVDTDAPSYQGRLFCVLPRLRSNGSTLIAACYDRRAGFTPLCFSVDGMLSTEAGYFMR